MAIFVPGPAVAEIRGSQGGTVFSRNRHGQYTRQRSSPVNPQSQRQVLARDSFNTLATRWRDVLTQAQRDGWDVYANNTNWINGVGQVTHLTGMNHYTRSNTQRLAVLEPPIDDFPTEFGLPDHEDAWTFATDSTTQQTTVSFTFATDVDDQLYFFYMGLPQSGSRLFFGGPWRRNYVIKGDSTTPPPSPVLMDVAYPVSAGNRVWYYCRRADADGRLTEPFRRDAIVT